MESTPTNRLWHFHGGLKLAGHKKASTQLPLQALPIPGTLVLPLQQHVGEPAEPVVRSGQYVYKGQVVARGRSYISAPVHASSSGTVLDVAPRPVPHPSGLSGPCIVIETDGRDRWLPDRLPGIEDPLREDPAEIRLRVRECGIVGLGGAAFPSAVKLNPRPSQAIHTLVLNGVECEPYITCDETLMRERADQVIQGSRIIRHTLGGPRAVLAVEEDMPHAIEAMREALKDANDPDIDLVVVPALYPSGGERQLIKILTGEEVPSDGLPADIGIVCHNVATSYAVHRAVRFGEPQLSRIVTVAGEGIETPRNVEAPLGAAAAELIAFAGGYKPEVQRLIMGGPMMGFALNTDEVPVIKAMNCLLTCTSATAHGPAAPTACIRCGECERVCPAQLLPQQLLWHTQSRAFDKAQEYDLFDCIECGCCAYVCPSRIPLVQYYRHAKSRIWDQERQREASDIARRRHVHHQQRVEREEAERAARLARRKAALSTKPKAGTSPKRETAIAESVERARAKKCAAAGTKPASSRLQEGDDRNSETGKNH